MGKTVNLVLKKTDNRNKISLCEEVKSLSSHSSSYSSVPDARCDTLSQKLISHEFTP